MMTGTTLQSRSVSTCELCGSADPLNPFPVPPEKDNSAERVVCGISLVPDNPLHIE